MRLCRRGAELLAPRPRAAGQVEQLERVVQGDGAAPQRLWLGEGGGRTLAETLRVNTTLASLRLCGNGLCEGGGRTLAEALHVNTTVTELDLEYNDLREEAQSALGQARDRGEKKKFVDCPSKGQLHKGGSLLSSSLQSFFSFRFTNT